MNNFAAEGLHISIAAQELFNIAGFSVTNALLIGFVGLLVTFAILVYTGWSIKTNHYDRFVGLVMWVFEALINQVNDIIPNKNLARKITPVAVTIFFAVLINYWLTVIPGLESITYNGVPVLRSSTADLNFTLAIALITTFSVQIYAIKYLGLLKNFGRYIKNPIKGPIEAFEGFLELIGEVSRTTALALRLFGNAFAGEVLLIVISILTSYAASLVLPVFMIFELFIGLIQAYVFFILTLIFTALAVSHNNHSIDHKPATKVKGVV